MLKNIHPMARRLILVRGLRSLGQGALVVDLALYLKALHWSAVSIGGVLSSGGLFGALLILFIGVLSDRLGRKGFLIAYELLTMASALTALLSADKVLLFCAIIVAGFGRGASGGAGPFMPAEQAWLTTYVERKNRGSVFSFNNAVGFLGMAIGALLGGTPHFLQAYLSQQASFYPIFIFVLVLSFVQLLFILTIQEVRSGGEQPAAAEKKPDSATTAPNRFKKKTEPTEEIQVRKRENKALLQLAGVTMLNGLAVGLTGPMMSYWFAERYHVSSAAIGGTIALSFVLTSISSLINGWLSGRMGMVSSTTRIRLIAVILMCLLPLAPTFGAATVIYVIRIALNRGTQGNRAALSASITRDHRRGTALSVNAFAMRMTAAAGPTVSGYLMELGEFALPFYLTAALQFGYTLLYQKLFRKYEDEPAAKTSKA